MSSSIGVLSPEWDEYELLDSGAGQKLERFGNYTLVRGEPKAIWGKSLSSTVWKNADAIHRGETHWKIREKNLNSWPMSYDRIRMEARVGISSKHLGIFPEQEPHWRWMSKQMKKLVSGRLLILFGYTGIASLVGSSNGWETTHVDASKPSVNWAKKNHSLSGDLEGHIRWILEDARNFIKREIRRGYKYDGIVLDPPAFGRGPKGDVWKLDRDLMPLLEDLKKVKSDNFQFALMTLYSIENSSITAKNLIRDLVGKDIGNLENGELAITESNLRKYQLPLSLYSRWQK